ncbi:Selenocysteine lyase/Cysteine desulfurase [Spirosomataceae bacterium TFI 002]|nr:Selenocysteine lyase/Cysteine desulfurase [Spirosomataceae bacterium TFI 002]
MKQTRRSFLGTVASSTLISNITFGQKKESGYWQGIRKQFPLTDKRVYLNNGTFGPSPQVVLDTIQQSFKATNTSGEYGHTTHAREVLAKFVGAKTEEISLTHNTTEGINIVCWGLPLKKGDEVIISLHEHVGNALPWLNRAKLDGIKLIPFEPKATQAENLDLIKKLTTRRTKAIAIPHITCTTGLVFPIKEIAEFARKKDIFTAIDGAHGSGTFDLDLHDLGCDFYATSCHKWMLGPNGTGFLYLREEILDKLQAIQVGAYSDTGWDMYSNPPLIKGYNPTAHRFDYGSQSKPMYEGAAASAEFQINIGKQKIENRVRELNNYLFKGLSAMKSRLDILSPTEEASRICMVTFKPKNKDYQEFAQAVSKEGFRIRQLPESNLDAIRISTHIYNSKEEIDSFLKVVERHV